MKQILVGITGNIGSGKSLVSSVIQEFGYPVFDADLSGRTILDHHRNAIEAVKKILGDSVYADGKADRKKIAAIVFKDPEKLKALNEVIHPLVAEDFEQWRKNQKTDLIFREAAIMIESGAYRNLDHLILVKCPEQTRIDRVIQRDKSTPELVLQRIKNQMPEEEKEKYADFVIVNDGFHAVIPQIQSLIHQLTSHAHS
ncbi:MAG: dephospho-CoA kinase [Flavobacteriales bacterium]|nr:dephospho-CoA kinase [Flavobacteriales bacterium]